MHDYTNPFQAPQARVADAAAFGGAFVLEARRLPAGRGAAWFSQGWELFRQESGTWIGLMLVLGVAVVALSMIPLLGLAVNVFMPVFAGGLMLGCKTLDEGGELRFGHLFAGFSRQFGNLATIGLINLGVIFLVGLAAGLVAGVGGLGVALAGKPAAAFGLGFLVMALAVAAVSIPLAMAVWFAPALVMLNEVPPVQAMKASFSACLRNFLPFLVYGLVGLALAIVATIPILLGWLALMPTLCGSVYAAYRDLFTAGET